MCFTDLPYNVNYANSAKDKLRGKNRPILNDALGESFGALLYDASVSILTVTKGAVYICMSSSELDTLQKAFREAGGKWSTFRSEEHTSELQSLMRISYAVFCLKTKIQKKKLNHYTTTPHSTHINNNYAR